MHVHLKHVTACPSLIQCFTSQFKSALLNACHSGFIELSCSFFLWNVIFEILVWMTFLLWPFAQLNFWLKAFIKVKPVFLVLNYLKKKRKRTSSSSRKHSFLKRPICQFFRNINTTFLFKAWVTWAIIPAITKQNMLSNEIQDLPAGCDLHGYLHVVQCGRRADHLHALESEWLLFCFAYQKNNV